MAASKMSFFLSFFQRAVPPIVEEGGVSLRHSRYRGDAVSSSCLYAFPNDQRSAVSQKEAASIVSGNRCSNVSKFSLGLNTLTLSNIHNFNLTLSQHTFTN